MTPAAALLPLCIALGVLALIVAIFLWLKNRRGRAVQVFGVGMLPFGLYLTGLLGLLVSALQALGRWAQQLVFNPGVWIGFGLIGLTVVLWIVGGMIARRSRDRRVLEKASGGDGTPASGSRPAKQVGQGSKTKGKQSAGDSDMDEIEALLKSRGIE